MGWSLRARRVVPSAGRGRFWPRACWELCRQAESSKVQSLHLSSPTPRQALAGKKHRNKIAAAANLPPWNAEQERALKDDDPWSSWKFRRSDQTTLLTAIPYTHFARVAPSHGLMQAFYPPYFVDTIPYDDFFAVIGQVRAP